jgi:thymidylate kinase
MGDPIDVLEVVSELIDRLTESGIGYAHWKSNEHLLPALHGDTDLDLLVSESDKGDFEKLVLALGFLPLSPARARYIPGSDSYLGLDRSSGRLVHLDVQYHLTVGEQLLKNHRLPVESWVLAGARDLHGVRVPEPERELLLLYVRTMLKTTTRQLVRSRVKGGSPVPDRMITEAQWLVDQVSHDALQAVSASSGLDITGDELVDFSDRVRAERLDLGYIADRRRSLRRRFAGYRRMPAHRALPKKLMLRLRSRPWANRLHIDIPKRRLAEHGLLVAAVGADGSGKTRLTKDLELWLQPKIQVRHVYFGQPKSGLIFKLLNKPGSMARNSSSPRALASISRYTDAVKWVLLARKRRRMAMAAQSESEGGRVVIAERFPLEEFFSMEAPMDGPRLQPNGPLAGTEMRHYLAIEPPDLTIVLRTDLQTLRDRKIDLTVEEHTAKVAAVADLAASNSRVVIDAGQPYEDVLLAAQNAIWRAIRESR